MNWSPKQQEAIERVTAWLNDPHSDQIFRLFGYAGTGKTTIAKTLADIARELFGGEVRFAAFTGKAAHVLKTKGCPAQTIHSLIYIPRDKSRARLAAMKKELEAREDGTATQREEPRDEFTEIGSVASMSTADLKREIEKERENVNNPSFCINYESDLPGCSLLILDEVSMVDNEMAQDLLSFGVKILALGDPAQLPPVGKGGFFTKPAPDYLLTEVHRQAEGDPIIGLATTVREGGRIYPGDGGGETQVISKAYLKAHPELAVDADQVLVGMNKTRRTFINRLRETEGRTSELPEKGDRVICLRNAKKEGLLNGQIFEVVAAQEPVDDVMTLTVLPEDAPADAKAFDVDVHCGEFRGDDVKKKFECDNWGFLAANHFDFANAITVHKSQGSQWDHVLVYDESWVFSKRDKTAGPKHLYTAITRAAKRVTVVV